MPLVAVVSSPLHFLLSSAMSSYSLSLQRHDPQQQKRKTLSRTHHLTPCHCPCWHFHRSRLVCGSDRLIGLARSLTHLPHLHAAPEAAASVRQELIT